MIQMREWAAALPPLRKCHRKGKKQMIIIKPRLKEIGISEKPSFYEPSAEEIKEYEKLINTQVEKFGLLDPLNIEPALIFMA